MYGNINSNQTGPNVSSSYPLGRYMEDNDYLGDLGYTQGVDFDLDQYNGRICVTPDFPTPIYAYFVAISSNGTPVFPYNIGRGFYGNPTGASVTAITETVTTNFVGESRMPPLQLNRARLEQQHRDALLERGRRRRLCQVQSTTNFSSWSTNATNLSPVGSRRQFYSGGSANDSSKFFRVARTTLANYDSVASSGYGIASISPTNATRWHNFHPDDQY